MEGTAGHLGPTVGTYDGWIGKRTSIYLYTAILETRCHRLYQRDSNLTDVRIEGRIGEREESAGVQVEAAVTAMSCQGLARSCRRVYLTLQNSRRDTEMKGPK